MNAMNSNDLSETITVAAKPEAVFAAINNLRGWWSGIIEGETAEVGDIFSYRYKDIHLSTQEVIEQVPGRRVAWKVLDSNLSFLKDKAEWTGTTITFDIAKKGDRTEVVFTHVGLKPAVECYDTCSDAWTSLIQGSLKQLIVTGRTVLLELDAPAA